MNRFIYNSKTTRPLHWGILAGIMLVLLSACGSAETKKATPSMTSFSATPAPAGGVSTITVGTTGDVAGVTVFAQGVNSSDSIGVDLTAGTSGTWSGQLTMFTTPGEYDPTIVLKDASGGVLDTYYVCYCGPYFAVAGNYTAIGNLPESFFKVTGTVTYPTLTAASISPTAIATWTDYVSLTFTASLNTVVTIAGVNLITPTRLRIAEGMIGPNPQASPMRVDIFSALAAGQYGPDLFVVDTGRNYTHYYWDPAVSTTNFTMETREASTGTLSAATASPLPLSLLTVN